VGDGPVPGDSLAVRRATAAACLLAAVLAGGCGTKKLDIEDAEKTIGARLGEQSGAKVLVDCPNDVEIKRGDTFDCRATAQGTRPATVRVTQLDDEGKVRWVVIER
jgi:Domain of unknown function (DUF4333)